MSKDPNKPRKMLKLFKGAGRVLKGVAKGVLDTVLPNTHQTIEITAPTLTQDKQVNINWPRLVTAVTVWILLILVLAGKISFTDIKDFVNSAVNAG
jgi:hypothetical protein